MKGKIITLEGIDGSGKATQSKKLVERLNKEGFKSIYLDFPQYDNNFFGEFLSELLQGKYGDFLSYHPKVASIFYACDRFETKNKITEYINNGFNIVFDRYVSSNKIHQGGKIKDLKKRQEFLSWLNKMEYEIFKLPKPNLTIFLNVDPKTTHQLLSSESKIYSGGKRGLPEKSLDYQNNSLQLALWLKDQEKNWLSIDCLKENQLLSIETIHEKIYQTIFDFFS